MPRLMRLGLPTSPTSPWLTCSSFTCFELVNIVCRHCIVSPSRSVLCGDEASRGTAMIGTASAEQHGVSVQRMGVHACVSVRSRRHRGLNWPGSELGNVDNSAPSVV